VRVRACVRACACVASRRACEQVDEESLVGLVADLARGACSWADAAARFPAFAAGAAAESDAADADAAADA
jgi:hypothetical protein